MLGSISGQFRRTGALACVGLLVTGIIACAASKSLGPAVPGADVIADVRVEQEFDATVVTLLGLDEPVFTAFQQPDPDRVIVDLASVEPTGWMEPVAVYDGLVEEVSLSPFSTGTGDSMTRVEVSLAAPADYSVFPTDEGLVIRVEAVPGLGYAELTEGEEVADSSTESGSDPWAIVPRPDETPERAEAASDEAPAPAREAPPATSLLGVEAREMGDGSLIELRADGEVASAMSFTLEDPARLVIDLPGLVSVVDRARVEIGSPHVARVRIGQHENMVRVVIDAGDTPEPFEGRRLIPAPNGLLVALGSGESLDWAVAEAVSSMEQAAETPEPLEVAGEMDEPAAEGAAEAASEALPEPAAEEAAESAEAEPELPAETTEEEVAVEVADLPPVMIYGVEFDAQDSRDRIVVLGERPVDYLVYEPDEQTVVVSIERAVIDPEAAVRIAPEPGGPVSLVTAFEQPDVDSPEVRLVVKRAAGLEPEVSRRGSLLVVDFARTGAAAATPPVLASVPVEPVLDEASPVPAESAAALETAALAPETSTPAAAVPAAPSPSAAAASLGPEGAQPASLEPPAAIDILREGGLIDGKEYTGRRISLDFKDVEIADVLRLIAEVSDLNVIAGDEVSGAVTIRLVDVPWDQALDVILLTKGLGFMRVGNVLRIAPAEVIQQEEETRLQERRAKEKLEDLVVKLQPVNYANVKDVEKMVKQLLTARGSVNTDTRTNTLIIKDIPSVIDEATALIKAIDTQTPQVMIEAKIVEANLEFSREFGSTWSIGAQPLVDPFDSASGPRRDLGTDDFRFHNSDNSSFFGNNAVFTNPITAFPSGLFNLAAFVLDEKLNLELQLQAAEVNGDGKVISSPRIVTLDNSEASIEQGVSIPFQTFENGDAQLEFVDAVLELKVTPHITADRSIIMEIAVTRNAPDDSVFTLTGSPAIAKNEVQTETLVKDGQTLVLGGIYVIDKSQRQSRIPYLHAIPILGRLFRSDELSDARKELLVFVTPRVVVTAEAAL